MFYPDKLCVISPAELPPDPKKLLSEVKGIYHHCGTSTPMVNKTASKEQPVSLTPIKAQKIDLQTKVDNCACSLNQCGYVFTDQHREPVTGSFRIIWSHSGELIWLQDQSCHGREYKC